MKTPEELANEHWGWLQGFIDTVDNERLYSLQTVEYLYKTAFIHGYKHGKER